MKTGAKSSRGSSSRGGAKSEAEHDALLVEEAPGSRRFLVWNLRITEGKERLAQVTREHLEFAIIGHSHLRQTTHNAYDGVAVSKENTILKPYCILCKLDLALIKAADPEYAQACTDGIRWEVLAWEMEKEHPTAVTIIQSVLWSHITVKQSFGMHTNFATRSSRLRGESLLCCASILA